MRTPTALSSALLLFCLLGLYCATTARAGFNARPTNAESRCWVDFETDCCSECMHHCRTVTSGPHYQKHLERCNDLCTGVGQVSVKVDTVHSDIGGPTAIEFARLPGDDPDYGNRMFIAQQHGVIHYSEQGHGGALTELLDISSSLTPLSSFYDEEGLMGLAFHPDFINNGRFYIMFTAPPVNATSAPSCSFAGGSGPGTRNGADIDGRPYDPDEYTSVINIDEYQAFSHASGTPPSYTRRWLSVKHPFSNHNGIDSLMFEENGDLLAVMGDGGCYLDQYGFGQNRSHILGKVIILDVTPQSTVTPQDCTTEVSTWAELADACTENSKLINLYASGVRNAGHMSMDVHRGRVNKYIGMIGQNRNELIYELDYENNYGWVVREGRECTCLENDPLRLGNCDYTQTQEECRSASRSIRAAYELPISAHNQVADRVSSLVGGHVYRGDELPCSLNGAYIYGEWARRDNGDLGFPARFSGGPIIWVMHPDLDGHNEPLLSHSEVLVDGWVGPTWLYSMGYDQETRELYAGTNGQVAPVSGMMATPSTSGRVYKFISPV